MRSRLAALLSISGGMEDESALAKRPAIASAADAGPALFSLLGFGPSESCPIPTSSATGWPRGAGEARRLSSTGEAVARLIVGQREVSMQVI